MLAQLTFDVVASGIASGTGLRPVSRQANESADAMERRWPVSVRLTIRTVLSSFSHDRPECATEIERAKEMQVERSRRLSPEVLMTLP